MSLKLNVIDREGKQTTIDIEEGTTIRNAIDDVLFSDNYGVCGGKSENVETATYIDSVVSWEAIESGLIVNYGTGNECDNN